MAGLFPSRCAMKMNLYGIECFGTSVSDFESNRHISFDVKKKGSKHQHITVFLKYSKISFEYISSEIIHSGADMNTIGILQFVSFEKLTDYIVNYFL